MSNRASVDVRRCEAFSCSARRVEFYALFRRISLCMSRGLRRDGGELFLSRTVGECGWS